MRDGADAKNSNLGSVAKRPRDDCQSILGLHWHLSWGCTGIRPEGSGPPLPPAIVLQSPTEQGTDPWATFGHALIFVIAIHLFPFISYYCVANIQCKLLNHNIQGCEAESKYVRATATAS